MPRSVCVLLVLVATLAGFAVYILGRQAKIKLDHPTYKSLHTASPTSSTTHSVHWTMTSRDHDDEQHGITSRFKAFKNKISGAFRKDKHSDSDTIRGSRLGSPSSTLSAGDTLRTNSKPSRKNGSAKSGLARKNTGVSSNSLVSTVSYPGSMVDELFEPYSRYVKPSPSNDIEAAAAREAAARDAAGSSFFGPLLSKISSRASTYHRTSLEDNPPITKSVTATTMPEDDFIDTNALIYPAKSSATDIAYHDDDENSDDDDEEAKINPGYRQWKQIRREWRRGAKDIQHKESMLNDIPESMYPKIYKHMVVQSRPLKQPMNLADAMKVIKAGWIEDGEWGAAELASKREKERLQREEEAAAAKLKLNTTAVSPTSTPHVSSPPNNNSTSPTTPTIVLQREATPDTSAINN